MKNKQIMVGIACFVCLWLLGWLLLTMLQEKVMLYEECDSKYGIGNWTIYKTYNGTKICGRIVPHPLLGVR